MLGAAIAIADVFSAFSAHVGEDLQPPFMRDLDNFVILVEVIQAADGPAQVRQLGDATLALLVSYIQLCQRHHSSLTTGQHTRERDQDSDEDSIGILSDDPDDMEAKNDVMDEYAIEAAEQDAYEMLSDEDFRYAMEAGRVTSQLSDDEIGVLFDDTCEIIDQDFRAAIDLHSASADSEELGSDDEIGVLSDDASEDKTPAVIDNVSSCLIQFPDIEPQAPASSEKKDEALSDGVRKIIAMLDSTEGMKMFAPEECDIFSSRLNAATRKYQHS